MIWERLGPQGTALVDPCTGSIFQRMRKERFGRNFKAASKASIRLDCHTIASMAIFASAHAVSQFERSAKMRQVAETRLERDVRDADA